MMKGSYVSFDLEMGGFHAKSSTLTGSWTIFDEDFNEIDQLDFALESEIIDHEGNHYYLVCPQALAVNKIHLAEHERAAKSRKWLAEELKKLFKRHTERFMGVDHKGKAIVEKTKLTLIGQNVTGDLERIQKELPDFEFFKYISYIIFDLQ